MNVLIRVSQLTLFSFVISSDIDKNISVSVTNTGGILGPLRSSNTGTDGVNSLDSVNSDQTRPSKHAYTKHEEDKQLLVGITQKYFHKIFLFSFTLFRQIIFGQI